MIKCIVYLVNFIIPGHDHDHGRSEISREINPLTLTLLRSWLLIIIRQWKSSGCDCILLFWVLLSTINPDLWMEPKTVALFSSLFMSFFTIDLFYSLSFLKKNVIFSRVPHCSMMLAAWKGFFFVSQKLKKVTLTFKMTLKHKGTRNTIVTFVAYNRLLL